MKSLYNSGIFLIILLTVYLTGCLDFSNIFGDDDDIDTTPPVYLTDIIGIKIDPNPALVGDSITFTCMIKDSLETAFYFKWHIMPKDTIWTRTEENTYKIKAPNRKGFYDGIVEAVKDGPPFHAVPSEVFTYEVIKKEE